MPLAALYDVHGNLPALEAVLADIRREGVEQIVVGGDVLPGPMPLECIELFLELEVPVHFIMGNGDREVLARMSNTETDWYRTACPEWREPIDWTAQQLSPKHANVIATWPATVTLNIDGVGDVLFCHATPRNDTDIFTRATSEDKLLPIFGKVEQSPVVCGHTHMQFDRMVGKTRVINAGSVGMPFGRTGADWLLLNSHVQFRHTSYDMDDAAERIRQTQYPQASTFVEQYVRHSPDKEAMMQAYRRAELS
jgi:predicted phosphodiesterase